MMTLQTVNCNGDKNLENSQHLANITAKVSWNFW